MDENNNEIVQEVVETEDDFVNNLMLWAWSKVRAKGEAMDGLSGSVEFLDAALITRDFLRKVCGMNIIDSDFPRDIRRKLRTFWGGDENETEIVE